MPDTESTRARGAMRARWLLRCVLLGLVAAAVAGGVSLLDMGKRRQYEWAGEGLLSLSNDLRTFHARFGRFPSEAEGFQALVGTGLLESIPMDPWNRPFRYRLEGGVPVVETHGADKAPGGEGYDADLSRRVEPGS